MPLSAALLTAYLVTGLLFGLVVVISEKGKKSSFGPTAPFVDEYTFWFFLLLWPVMGAVWTAKKRKEARARGIQTVLEEEKKGQNQPLLRNASKESGFQATPESRRGRP